VVVFFGRKTIDERRDDEPARLICEECPCGFADRVCRHRPRMEQFFPGSNSSAALQSDMTSAREIILPP